MFLSVFAKIRGGVAILNTKFNKSIGIWNLRRLLEIPIWFVANIVSTSLAGESFFSFFWQSPRDDVLVKIRVSITVLGWCQEGHLVSHKILPHLNLWNGKNYWLTKLRKWDWIFFEVRSPHMVGQVLDAGLVRHSFSDYIIRKMNL